MHSWEKEIQRPWEQGHHTFSYLGGGKALACVAGRRKGGRKVKMSAGGRRDSLQGHYCFLCFFRPPDERKNLIGQI